METNDMKAMREALQETQSVIAKCLEILNKIPDSCGYGGFIEDVGDELCYLRDEHVNAALAKSPRVCDVMSEEDLTNVVTSGFLKSLEARPEFNIVGAKALAEAAISAAIKCAYDTQLVSKTEGATDDK